MTLDEMLRDYVRRAPTRYTVGQLREIIRNNHILIGDGCFIIYALALDEVHILFPYAAIGRGIEPIGRELERRARAAGYSRIKIITARDKAFARKFRDYRPTGTIFEKELR